jgi:hypothetical protein
VSETTRSAVEAIIARDGLVRLAPEDVQRLITLYAELQPELELLRAPEVDAAEPAVIFTAA